MDLPRPRRMSLCPTHTKREEWCMLCRYKNDSNSLCHTPSRPTTTLKSTLLSAKTKSTMNDLSVRHNQKLSCCWSTAMWKNYRCDSTEGNVNKLLGYGPEWDWNIGNRLQRDESLSTSPAKPRTKYKGSELPSLPLSWMDEQLNRCHFSPFESSCVQNNIWERYTGHSHWISTTAQYRLQRMAWEDASPRSIIWSPVIIHSWYFNPPPCSLALPQDVIAVYRVARWCGVRLDKTAGSRSTTSVRSADDTWTSPSGRWNAEVWSAKIANYPA